MTLNNITNIYTISPDQPFVDSLASNLLHEYKDTPEKLSDILIMLPTRRTCRALRDSFLKKTEGTPLLLPKIRPIGDIDAEELSLSLAQDDLFDLNAPIPSMKRQLLLARLIAAKRPDQSGSVEQDLGLAQALGHLIDQIHTENLDFKTLPSIVEKADIAEHWQITLDFLEIISLYWPKILKQAGYTDAAEYRNALLTKLNEHWQKNPPQHPVIMAGSTASIPAVSALAKTILLLPYGKLIIPGLNKVMDETAWQSITEGHPQATLKNLLEFLNITRDDVKNYTQIRNQSRLDLISNIMLPAEQTIQWSHALKNNQKKYLIDDLTQNIFRYDCDTIQEEADTIALILRETLEDKDQTACVITTNRALARRITQRCKFWNIEVDDTAGQNLKDTALGQYLLHSLSIFTNNFDSVSLLSFLKHDYTSIKTVDNFRQNIRNFEIEVLRGKPIKNGIEGIKNRLQFKIKDPHSYQKPSEGTINFLKILEENIDPFSAILHHTDNDFSVFLTTHIKMVEHFYGFENQSLWSGESGNAAANLLSELYEYAGDIGKISLYEYEVIIKHFIGTVTVRPKFGTHPRLQILGQIEGRMVQANRVILAGLNEGSWPPDPGHDPWMSRPMRQRFGLPSPERSITLAAHDFCQAFCAPQIYLTRASKMDGAPTVPARWLERFNTYLSAHNISNNLLTNGTHLSYNAHLDAAERTKEITRPAPCPPIEARPTYLSVTSIDKWMKDPYSIYAQKILKLEKLLPLNEVTSASDKGIIFHEILHRFNKQYPNHLNDQSANDFVDVAIKVLEENIETSESLSFWRPRLMQFAHNYIDFESKWREKHQLISAEIKGSIDFKQTDNIDFTLTARVDRIDRHADGSYAIIDYKSGGQYSATNLKTGALSQLPLEGLILTEGTYDAIQQLTDKNVSYLGYWKIENSKQTINEIKTKNLAETIISIVDTKAGLLNLITTYQNPDTSYLAIPDLNNAPRFNDYAYLERIKEWAALDEPENIEAY